MPAEPAPGTHASTMRPPALCRSLRRATMNERVTTLPSADYGYGISQEQRHQVLLNTYWLLALSLLPTVLGAWIGVATGITAALNGILGLVVFLGGAFGFIYAIEKTKNSAAGVPMLLGFRLFMGLMLSRLIAIDRKS